VVATVPFLFAGHACSVLWNIHRYQICYRSDTWLYDCIALKSTLIVLQCLLGLSEDLPVAGRHWDVPTCLLQVPARFSSEIPGWRHKAVLVPLSL